MIRILQVDMSGEALRAKIEANLALAVIARIVCNPSRAQAKRRYHAAMPRFVTAFLEMQLAT